MLQNKPLLQNRFGRTLGLVLCIALAVSACGDGGKAKKGKHQGVTHLVEAVTVQRQQMNFTAELAGSLHALREVKLFNQEEGRVLAVLVREGDSVRRGRALIRMDDRILRAQLAKALAMLNQANIDVQRLQGLIKQQLVSEDALSRAKTTRVIAQADVRLLRTRVSYMTIRAPFAGQIASRDVEMGDVAPKHTQLMTIVDTSSLITEVAVSELVLQHLKIGSRAEVRIDALGKTVYPGKILRIYPTIDPATRRGRIEVTLNPVPKGARPGQFCRVTLHTTNSRNISIPLSALRRDASGEFVYVLGEDSKAQRVTVESGLRLADMVEIRTGLQVGQQVITRGFLGLAQGQPVKVVGAKPVEMKKPVQPARKEKPSSKKPIQPVRKEKPSSKKNG